MEASLYKRKTQRSITFGPPTRTNLVNGLLHQVPPSIHSKLAQLGPASTAVPLCAPSDPLDGTDQQHDRKISTGGNPTQNILQFSPSFTERKEIAAASAPNSLPA